MKTAVLTLFFAFAFTFDSCYPAGQEHINGIAESEKDNNSNSGTAGKNDGSMKIRIRIGTEIFSAVLTDTPAGVAFAKQLPMTVKMSEHNGNEKYYYLPEDLPVSPFRPKEINTGDIMLYGTNCIVIFYKTFSPSFNYTRLGAIEDTAHLRSVLGSGSVTVSFEAENDIEIVSTQYIFENLIHQIGCVHYRL